ncbi:MAG TPA: hypothetical protein VH796_10535 [Nitrososphaeraceae archaeon]
MSLTIRPIELNDVESCGKIGYEAHRTIASAHGYPSEQPSEEFGIGLIRMLLGNSNQLACKPYDDWSLPRTSDTFSSIFGILTLIR